MTIPQIIDFFTQPTDILCMALSEQIKSLPTQPGVYLYKNKRGDVLYVGKAKNLRNRVRSYFGNIKTLFPSLDLEPAKQKMIKLANSVETIICDTEHEAFILEASLIRRHKPPYNIVLTDDKSYLFIKITKEEWPRVFPVRRIIKDNAKYFGPYSSARSVRQTLKLLQRLFPHRTEKDSKHEWIFPHPLFNGSDEPQSAIINNLNIDHEHYLENIQNIIKFLSGERDYIQRKLQQGMKQAAQEYAYERATIFRDQLQAIERLEGSQKVLMAQDESFDVISTATQHTRSAVNVFQIRHGKLVNKNTFLMKHPSDVLETDLVRQFVVQYYRDASDIPTRVLVPATWPDSESAAKWINPHEPLVFTVPQRGKKRQLLMMGESNAQHALSAEQISFAQDQRLLLATRELAQALNLDKKNLHRIETYDISNIQGQLATGSMVVFVNGKPSSKHYRKFRIKQGSTPNDYAMLAEVLERRLQHQGEDWTIPDLIIVDGGKGQLHRAEEILKKLNVQVSLAALAKREELLFVPNRPEPVRLPYDSDALYLVQRMRDEAHRFTIQYHRQLRSKRSSRSLLDEIPGIGPKTKKRLLRRFGSLRAIREASDEELSEVIGDKAKIIKDYL